MVGIASMPAVAEIDYYSLYLVGQAAPCGWDEKLPEQMTYLAEGLFIWDGWLSEGDFKFLNHAGSWDGSIVADDENKTFESEQRLTLVDNTSNQHYDFKFYNTRPGYVRIIADLKARTVLFRRPVASLIGEAVCGWNDVRDQIPVFADDEGHVTWTGMLRRGEIKFLADGGSDWAPCYNAPWEGEYLIDGSHMLVHNYADTDADGNFVDFKYNIQRAGRYTLNFRITPETGHGSLDVTRAPEPELAGAFTAASGRYLVALNYAGRYLHASPLPSRLYIGTSGADCTQLTSDGAGRFAATVTLNAGSYYKLASDPADWHGTAYSPDTDVDITTATANVAPMHGYSYTVPATGQYSITADFTGSAPFLYARYVEGTTLIAGPTQQAAAVMADGHDIVVTGEYRDITVSNLAGVVISHSPRTAVSPGIYIVKVDSLITKIAVK